MFGGACGEVRGWSVQRAGSGRFPRFLRGGSEAEHEECAVSLMSPATHSFPSLLAGCAGQTTTRQFSPFADALCTDGRRALEFRVRQAAQVWWPVCGADSSDECGAWRLSRVCVGNDASEPRVQPTGAIVGAGVGVHEPRVRLALCVVRAVCSGRLPSPPRVPGVGNVIGTSRVARLCVSLICRQTLSEAAKPSLFFLLTGLFLVLVYLFRLSWLIFGTVEVVQASVQQCNRFLIQAAFVYMILQWSLIGGFFVLAIGTCCVLLCCAALLTKG